VNSYKKEDKDTSVLEHEIELLICKLYGITEEERRVIEGE
jgi:hypothetical protein